MRFTVKSTTTLILASKSPRRIELMTLAGFDFLSVPAVKEEKITGGTSPSDAVLMLSRQKAEEIAEKYPYNTVIGADTVVALGNEIMGKPENEQDAFNMLKKLSGKTHTVLTGVCVISPDKQINFYEKTEVEFYPLGDDEIRQYIASGEPMDKAGAYGIQEKGAMFVKRKNGDFYTACKRTERSHRKIIFSERTQRYVIFEQRIYKRYYGVRRRSAQGSKNRRRKDISFKRRYH